MKTLKEVNKLIDIRILSAKLWVERTQLTQARAVYNELKILKEELSKK